MNPAKEIIIELSKQTVKNRKILDTIKRKVAKKYKTKILSNSQLLKAYHELIKDKRIKPNLEIEEVLRIRKVRSLSGIVIVAVLTSPHPQWGTGQSLTCPGKCLYCPQQKDVPKSYLKEEPAVARAIKFQYHPYKQVRARIRALEAIGHPTDKIDLRIIGGTWSYYPKRYQTWFITRCFAACNAELCRTKCRTMQKIKSLREEQKINEKAKRRIIGITIETRPDFINKQEIKRLRQFGVTRVELGVQSVYDDVLKLNKRGHSLQATIEATRLLKDAGFKICYQMMPNLLGSDMKKDVEMFRELFSDASFKPDYLKIYPCALLKEAPLFKLWKKGQYKPYTEKQLVDLLIKIKKLVPYYCRIQRIIRDIPSSYVVEGGTKTSNLRQIIEKIAKEQGWRCRCIRCREIREKYNPKEKIYLFRIDYNASQGKEIFLSFENRKRTKLYSLLRLRLPSQTILPVLKNSAIIREIHTYGKLVPIAQKKLAPQHRGLGKKLIKEAEKIAKKEFGLKKIAIISGIGVRNYYRKLGYRLRDTYMIKEKK